jgi:thiol-disulfide isomerase/thioredoxin
MKNFILTTCIFITGTFHSGAQSQYIVLTDSAHSNTKILKGLINKINLANDTAFSWYAESRRIYPVPDTSAVAALKKNADKIFLIIFGGTWCDDSQFILPKFFKIQEAAGFPESRITLFAVDRNKTTIGTIAQAMNILDVPTIIVMKDGKELGRLVEYGKTGKWDKELAGIINQ